MSFEAFLFVQALKQSKKHTASQSQVTPKLPRVPIFIIFAFTHPLIHRGLKRITWNQSCRIWFFFSKTNFIFSSLFQSFNQSEALRGANVAQCDENLCDALPCMNSAICVPSPGSYTCQCPVGFHGSNCELSHDGCFENTRCASGSTCVPVGTSFRCSCPFDKTGDLCETNQGKTEG